MLDWREGMALDHGMLDDDHRRQMTLIRRFVAIPGEEEHRAKASAVLEALRDVTLRHFIHEERVQVAIRYPHIAEHKAQHQRLASMLNELIAQVEAQESAFSFAYVKQQADQNLQFWFLDHFAKADMRLKAHLAKVPGLIRQQAPPPQPAVAVPAPAKVSAR